MGNEVEILGKLEHFEYFISDGDHYHIYYHTLGIDCVVITEEMEEVITYEWIEDWDGKLIRGKKPEDY